MLESKIKLFLNRANVVGTIHTPSAFRSVAPAAAYLDLVEVRADLISMPCLKKEVPNLPLPFILTVRHPSEGGGGGSSIQERRDRFYEFFDHSALIDLELRSMKSLGNVWEAAAQQRIARIVSWHDFKKTPSASVLRDFVKRAEDTGADIVKVATFLKKPSDLGQLLELFDLPLSCSLAVMGMGTFGRVSRLVLAAAGSVLNYGWLHKPQVPGQWPAIEFSQMLNKVTGKDRG